MNPIEGLAALAIDCTDDPAGLGRWYQGLLGGELEVDADGCFIAPAGSVVLARCGGLTTRARGAMSCS